MTPESLARGNDITKQLADIEKRLAQSVQGGPAPDPLLSESLLTRQADERQQALIDMRAALQAEFDAL